MQSEAGPCRLYDASFVQLLSRPELFDQRRLVVSGYANLEFEGNALYLSEELYRHGSSRDAIWLDLEGISSPPSFRRGYAVVEGTFAAGPGGHLGMFGGTISHITRFDQRRD